MVAFVSILEYDDRSAAMLCCSVFIDCHFWLRGSGEFTVWWSIVLGAGSAEFLVVASWSCTGADDWVDGRVGQDVSLKDWKYHFLTLRFVVRTI